METKPIGLLLVEDNDDDILMVQKSFAKAKFVSPLNVVKDGEEAMAYLRRQGKFAQATRPGIVLLDIQLPKKDGWSVLKEIKDDPLLRGIPVVVLTTSQQEEDVVKSYGEGACSFIAKPVGFQQFQQVAERFELYWALVARLPKPA